MFQYSRVAIVVSIKRLVMRSHPLLFSSIPTDILYEHYKNTKVVPKHDTLSGIVKVNKIAQKYNYKIFFKLISRDAIHINTNYLSSAVKKRLRTNCIASDTLKTHLLEVQRNTRKNNIQLSWVVTL